MSIKYAEELYENDSHCVLFVARTVKKNAIFVEKWGNMQDRIVAFLKAQIPDLVVGQISCFTS